MIDVILGGIVFTILIVWQALYLHSVAGTVEANTTRIEMLEQERINKLKKIRDAKVMETNHPHRKMVIKSRGGYIQKEDSYFVHVGPLHTAKLYDDYCEAEEYAKEVSGTVVTVSYLIEVE